MTVCISAICEDGKTAIVASDRMVTAQYPPIEFEHTRSKIHHLAPYCIAMTAGDALKPIEVIPKSKLTICDQRRSPSIEQIVDIVKHWYQFHRIANAEERILKPRTINSQTFYDKGLGIFPRDIFGYLDQEMANFNYGIELLIAGLDSTGAHIYHIFNPGMANCYDFIGFHAIGVGQLHAFQTFIAQRYSISCTTIDCLNVVYAAKKASEVAPGVGKETDMAMVREGQVIHITPEMVSALSDIYNQVTQPRQQEIMNASQLLAGLLSQAEAEAEKGEGDAKPTG